MNEPFYLIVLCLFLTVSTTSHAQDGTNHPGVRPQYEGMQKEKYNEITREIDLGMRELIAEDFIAMIKTAQQAFPSLPPIEIDLDSQKVLTIYSQCPSPPQIFISHSLRMTLYRIAQANVAISLSNNIDKKNGLAQYITELAKIYIAQHTRTDKSQNDVRPPEVTEFFGFTPTEMTKLSQDPNFNIESAFQWQSTMRSLLAHEIAHIALHCAANHTAHISELEFEADILARKIVTSTWPDEITSPLLANAFWIAYIYNMPGSNKSAISSMCSRTADELEAAFTKTKKGTTANPDINMLAKERYGIDINNIKSNDFKSFIRKMRAECASFQ